MKKTKSTKILVIENSLSDVQLVKGLLRQSSRHPFYVLTAHTLSQGLALLSASSVDAIILDLRLPDSQGLDTLLTIREQASHLPIIVLIVPGDDALGERALEEGAQRFLSKDALTLGVPYAPIFTRTIRFAIKQKQEQTELQKAREEMGALNKQLEATNEALEQRVQERTEELALMNEELQSTNEELRVANEEFQHETTQRARAEKTTRQNAERTAILNKIIHALNEAPDLPTLYERALTTILEQLKLESGLIATVSDTGRLTVEYAHNHPSEFIKAINGLEVDDNSFTRALYQRQEVVAWDITPPDTTSFRLSLKGAAVGIPFLSEGKVVGHVSFHAADRRIFTADEQALFRTIGLEFGTAIVKLRAKARVDEYSRQQTILNLVIAEGNRASDLTTALQAMLDTAMQIADVDYGAVYLLNEAEGLVELQHARGFSQEVLDATRRLPVTTPHYSDVYKGTPVFLDDFAKEGSELFRALVPELHTTVMIPLGAETHVIGHFGLGSSKIRGFADEERALLVAAGHQVGTVVARLQAEEQIKRYSLHLEDLVEERTAQLAQSEEYFRTLFEASSVGQVRLDAEGHPIRINKAAAELFGIHDVSDVSRWNFFSNPRISEQTGLPLREGQAIEFEQAIDFQAIKKTGEFPTTRSDVRHVYVYVLPLFSASHDTIEGYLSQLVDITERKLVEDALQDAQRLAGIGETTTMIGHDLRNPLQALQYSLELELMYFDAMPPEVKADPRATKAAKLVTAMQQQITYMDKIVSDLQDYARPLRIEREHTNIARLIENTLSALTIPESIAVHLDIPSPLTATIDPHLMQRALTNLTTNAVQAMPEGGELMIRAAAADSTLVITVQDTGKGVPQTMKDTLFSPLTTGKAKGTGLGLAVVKRIVAAHGGTIGFESEEGNGTTFTMTLPQTAD